MIEALVEGRSHRIALGVPHCRISISVERGKASHQLQQLVVKGRSQQGTFGLALRVLGVDEVLSLRRHAPVAIDILQHDVILHVMMRNMHHPPLHGIIMLLDRLHVTVLIVEHIGHREPGGRPRDVVVVDIPVARRHIGDNAVDVLCLGNVLQPLGIEAVVIEDEAFAQRAHGTVAEPPHALIALRAVGGHAAIVATYAPVGIMVDAVEHVVGGRQLARRGHLVVEHDAPEVVEAGRFTIATELHVAEAMIGERRLPRGGGAIADVSIGGLCRPQVSGVDGAICFQCFHKVETQRVAGLTLHFHLHPAHHVLSHVEQIATVGLAANPPGA
jgi:hypothetical protein